MHAIDLAELAATFVRGTAAQLALEQTPVGGTQQNYWLTARYRHENWMHALARHRDAISRPGASRRARNWHEVLPVIQEILLSEPLSRVVAYHAQVLDQLGISHDFSPLASSTLATHVEARNRCLHLIVFGPGLPVENAVSLNRLRRTLESYTDELLSCLPPIENCGQYCFDMPQLVKMQASRGPEARQTSWTMLHAACLSEMLWHAVRYELDWRAGNARLNYQLSQRVLSFSSPHSFDSFGVPHCSSFAKLLQTSPESAASTRHSHPLFCDFSPSSKLGPRLTHPLNLRRRQLP